MSRLARVLHRVAGGTQSAAGAAAAAAAGAQGHAQSVLRSGALTRVCEWVDAGFLVGEDKVRRRRPPPLLRRLRPRTPSLPPARVSLPLSPASP
jgi:hypothetical protein